MAGLGSGEGGRLIYEVDNEAEVVGVLRAWRKIGPETYAGLPEW